MDDKLMDGWGDDDGDVSDDNAVGIDGAGDVGDVRGDDGG